MLFAFGWQAALSWQGANCGLLFASLHLCSAFSLMFDVKIQFQHSLRKRVYVFCGVGDDIISTKFRVLNCNLNMRWENTCAFWVGWRLVFFQRAFDAKPQFQHSLRKHVCVFCAVGFDVISSKFQVLNYNLNTRWENTCSFRVGGGLVFFHLIFNVKLQFQRSLRKHESVVCGVWICIISSSFDFKTAI